MKLNRILLTILLLNQVRSECSAGCLRCSPLNECLFCDPNSGYILSNKTCLKKSVPNCHSYSFDSKCAVCNNNYYLSTKLNSCIQVQEWQQIQNCLKYTSLTDCFQCAPEFYQVDGQCVPVKTKIENCEIYLEAERCEVCKKGFTIVKPEQKKCKANQSVQNCQTYSSQTCQACPAGKIFFQNFEMENFLQHLQIEDFVFEQHQISKYQNFQIDLKQNCFTPKISNCLDYKDIYTCFKCQTGYYLEDGKCFVQPEPKIPNCVSYLNANACAKCDEKFYLKTNALCVPVSGIENCQIYDSTSSSEQCLQCDNRYFVQNNQCVLRKAFVDKCDIFFPLGDYCQECQPYYHLTDDKLKCLWEIANCKIYQISSQYQQQLYCKYCDDGFYFDKVNVLCVKGGVEFCQVYQQNTDLCEKCENQYYLIDGRCIRHNELAHCKEYDAIQRDVCKTCTFDSWEFRLLTQCVSAYVDGCLEFSSPTTCKKCKDWYDFVSDKECVALKKETHCQRAVLGVCQQCQNNYILNSKNQCRLPYNYLIKYCNQYYTNGKTTQDDDVVCDECQFQSTPITYQDHYFCVPENSISKLIKNCRSYEFNDEEEVFDCKFCEKGFYLSEGLCLPSCPEDTIIKRLKIINNGQFLLFENQDLCVSPTFEHCEIETFQVSSAFNIVNSCSKYSSTIYKFLDFSLSHRVVLSQDLEEPFIESGIFKLPLYQLQENLDQDVLLGSQKNGKIDNCEVYTRIGFLNKIGCAKCKLGYYGKVKAWKIDNCYRYKLFNPNSLTADYQDNLTCDECLDFYYLSEDKLKCIPMPHKIGCEKYYTRLDKCYSCEKDFYLPNPQTQCLANTVENCIYKSPISNTCLKCDIGYFLNQDSTLCIPSLPHCIQQSKQEPYKCEKCNFFYYPTQTANDTINQCLHGTVPYCWLYFQDQINKCEKYQNVIFYYQKNQCIKTQNLKNCLKRNLIDKCEVCDYKVSYMIESEQICCLYGEYFDGEKCAQIEVAFCEQSQFDSSTKCSVCQDLYTLQTNSLQQNVCCEFGSYLFDDKCIKDLNLDENDFKCAIFDKEKLQCVGCISGWYQAQSYAGCCEEGKYDLNGVCTDNPVENCLQYDSENQECVKCKSEIMIDQTTYQITNNKKCCLQNQYLDDNNCVNIPTALNCTEVQKIGQNWKCTDSCKSGYYYDVENHVCCSNQDNSIEYFNGTSCQVTTAIANCIQYNDQQKCLKCKENFHLTENKTMCCEAGSIFNGTECVKKTGFFDHCLKFENKVCVLCENNNYLQNGMCVAYRSTQDQGSKELLVNRGFKNCEVPSNDMNSCQICFDNFYRIQESPKICCEKGSILKEEECVDIQVQLKNCGLVDLSDFSCQNCESDGKEDFYKLNTSDICCKLGEVFLNGSCQQIASGENCLIKSGGDCLSCKEGYFLNDSKSCVQYPSKCKEINNSNECVLCEDGYTLKLDKSCVLLAELTNLENCPVDLIELNLRCISLNETGADCQCLKCRQNYNGDYCCLNGYYYDPILANCKQIENPNCSEYDSDTKNCTSCYTDSQLQLTENQKWKFSFTFPQFTNKILQDGVYKDLIIEHNKSKNYLASDTGQCCPLGQYYQLGACRKIWISNCAHMENNSCSECFSGFSYDSDLQLCCAHNELANQNTGKCVPNPEVTEICPEGQYSSNGFCCDIAYYWSQEFQQCLKIYDQFCAKSNDGIECTECIDGNFKEVKIFAKVELLNTPKVNSYFEKQALFIQLCSPYKLTTHKLASNIQQSLKNCQEFQQSTASCVKTFDNYTVDKIACKNNQIQELQSQRYFCKENNPLEIHCAAYSEVNKCSFCQQGYNLQGDICCKNYSFLTPFSNSCDLRFENCISLDSSGLQCSECEIGYYFSNNNCCKIGEFYNQNFKRCDRIKSKGLFACLKSHDNLNCFECSSDYYLSNQKCCPYNSYWYNGECIKNREALNCMQFDEYGNCIQCLENYVLYRQTCCPATHISPFPGLCVKGIIKNCTAYTSNSQCEQCAINYYLTNGICCASGEYGSQGACLSIDSLPNINCAKLDNAGNCSQCNEISYLHKTHCCLETFFFDTETQSCESIATPSCVQFNSSDECQKCTTDKMLQMSNKTCIDQVNNCEIMNGSDCIQCKKGYYQDLSITNYCAPYGYYFDNIEQAEFKFEDDIDKLTACLTTQSCQVCSFSYPGYKSQGNCVNYGQIWDSGQRKQIDIESGALDFKFCNEALEDASGCRYCSLGYKKTANIKQCEINDVVFRFDCSADINGDCELCKDGFYLSHGRCCGFMTYWNSTLARCVPINHLTSLDLNRNASGICLQISDSLCKTCKAGYTLFQGVCCETPKIFDGSCSAINTSSGVQACKGLTVISGVIKCEVFRYEEEGWRTASCLQPSSGGDMFYYHNGRCCEIGEMWQSGQCTSIPAVLTQPINSTCLMVNENNECIQNPLYLSDEGQACPLGQYKDNVGCQPVSIQNCLQQKDGICLLCSTKSSFDNKCCDQQVWTSLNTCEDVIIPNCLVYQEDPSLCASCKSTYYLHENKCIAFGTYLDGDTPTQIPTDNCLRYTATQGCIQCIKGFAPSYQQCCPEEKIYLQDFGCIEKKLILRNCQILNEDTDQELRCMLCQNGKIPENGICCDDGYFFDKDQLNNEYLCRLNSLKDTRCEIYENGGCQKCKKQYSFSTLEIRNLNSVDFKVGKCCNFGFTTKLNSQNQLTCESDQSNKIENCIQFGIDKKCELCYQGFNLLDSGDDKICCQHGQFVDSGNCVNFLHFYQKCELFDLTTLKCIGCQANYTQQEGYCVEQSYYYDLLTRKVQQSLNSEYCKIATKDECLECLNENFYLKNGFCCPLNYHWNPSYKACIRNDSGYCLRYDAVSQKCLECTPGAHLHQDTTCCPLGTALFKGRCRRLIKNCSTYTLDKEEPLCTSCIQNFILSKNQKACCREFSIINSENTCFQNLTYNALFENCIDYDPVNVKCLKCEANYYPSEGVCCELGKVYSLINRVCEVRAMPDNCNRFNVKLDQCEGCVEDYFLQADKSCKQFEKCLNFDFSTYQCAKCYTGYYVIDGQCCKEGEKWNGTMCVSTRLTEHCLKFENTNSCKECDFKYYKVQDQSSNFFCCPYEFYCNDQKQQVPGKVDFCSIYENDENNCVQCKAGFSKMIKLKTPKQVATEIICYPIQIENCTRSSLSIENIQSIDQNVLSCQTCDSLFSPTLIEGPSLEITHSHYMIPNCTKYDYAYLHNQSSFKCLGCKDGYFIHTDLDTSQQQCLVRVKSSPSAHCFETTHKFDTDECLECEAGYFLQDGACVNISDSNCLLYTVEDNCLYFDYEYNYFYMDYDNQTYPINKRRDDVVLKEVEAIPPYYYRGFIEYCEENHRCSQQMINGIPSYLQKYLSCYRCIENDRIPFVSIYFDFFDQTDSGLARFSLANSPPSKLSDFKGEQENFTNQCLLRDLSEFKLSGDNNFPENCAIGIINARNTASAQNADDVEATMDQLSVFCGACEFGYAPIHGTNLFHIAKCQKIEFCEDKGFAYNQCARCQEKYAFSKKISFQRSECVFGGQKAIGCLVFDVDEDECFVCQENYQLNEDKICEIIKSPNCEIQGPINQEALSLQFYEVALIRNLPGCLQCPNGHTALFKSKQTICTQRTYITNKELKPDSFFDYNCRTYTTLQENNAQEGPNISCSACLDDYYLNKENRCIKMNKNFQNCEIAEDSEGCFLCKLPYYQFDNICKLYNVMNCIKYERNGENQVVCTECSDEFLLIGQECVRGEVPFCKVYISKSQCDTCLEGYQKIQLVAQKDYCMPINQHPNCLKFDQFSMQQNNHLKCLSCAQDFYLKTLTTEQKVCNKFNQVQNCLSYVKNASLSVSSLNCSLCEENFYLRDNFCYTRNIIINKCAVYDIKSPRCLECDRGYYLSSDYLSCVLNPYGISNCIEYKNAGECARCRIEFYLESSTECKQVPFENLIPSCLYYESDSQCSACVAGKVLEGNACIDPLIQNCVEFISIRSCRRCIARYGIREIDDQFICEPKPAISNCQVQNEIYPFECQFCKQGYVLLGNNCFALTLGQIVENCLYYQGPNICLQCIKGYSLSLDQKVCQKIFLSNVCEAVWETEEAQCAMCEQGYYLTEKGECEVLEGDCLIYDRVNGICEICKTGFHQNSEKKCIKN